MTTCCVVGLGYIGLPTAAVLAKAGHRVIGVDVNAQVVATVNKDLFTLLSLILILQCRSVLPLVLFRPKSHLPRLMFLIVCQLLQAGPTASPAQYRLCLQRRVPLRRAAPRHQLESTSPLAPLKRWLR